MKKDQEQNDLFGKMKLRASTRLGSTFPTYQFT
jgi:hypothetical protein